ncbi:MAG: V-type ATP synthase subunit D [Vulcanimicrobiota bacterium]
MATQVKATRMELQKNKRQQKMAVRGHKLLKEKRDGLMQRFMGIIREVKKFRIEVEEKLETALNLFLRGTSYINPVFLKESLNYSDYNVEIEKSEKNIMGVRVPQFSVKKEGTPYSYGFTETTGDLDYSLKLLDELIPLLLELSHIEKSAQLLSDEIERTRRRVNALEYVMIPELEEAISYITMKLDEMERSKLTMLMKVKEIVEKEKTVD